MTKVKKEKTPKEKALYKTTIVIWSDYNPEGKVELSDLAQDAETGYSYCSKMTAKCIKEPSKDPDWDGTEFFDTWSEHAD